MKGKDQFESQLKRQSLATPPVAWRRDILSAALRSELRSRTNEAPRSCAKESPGRMSVVTSVAAKIVSQLLWPSGRAWGALAGVWVLIIGACIANRDVSEKQVAQRWTPSPLVRALLREQSRLFVELSGGIEDTESTGGRRPAPGPRSEGERMELDAATGDQLRGQVYG